MTGREKIEAALSPGGTTETPVVICYEGIYVRDHWDELTDCPWWYVWETDVQRQLRWRRDVLTRTGMDWFALPYGAARQDRQNVRIEETADGVFQVDDRTGRRVRLVRPGIGGWERTSGPVRPSMPDTFDQIDRLVPQPEAFDPACLADGRNDLGEAMLREFGELFPLCSVGSPLWRCYGLWGYEELMLRVATRPELIEHACRRFLAQATRDVQEAAARGAAGIWIEECLTDSISPPAFARLNVPPLRQLVEAIRAAGLKSIYYYCGNPADRWDLLLATGADALALEESKKHFRIDIDEAVRHARRRCAVLGNLDALGLLPHADREQLRAEIARQLAAGRRNGGRFVMSIGSPVTPGTSAARVREYSQLARELGRR